MSHAKRVLYKTIFFTTLFFFFLENTAVALAKAIFNDLEALKNTINGHDDDSEIIDKTSRISEQGQMTSFTKQQY